VASSQHVSRFAATALLRVQAVGWAVATAFVVAPAPVSAQATYPTKAIRVVVPFPAGTSPDVQARMWSQKLSTSLGQPVVVDNRPGAATIIGTQAATTAPADGYTLLYTAQNTMSINPYVYKNLPYKVEDFVPVSQIAAVPLVLIVAANSPIKSLSDLIQAAKEKPGALNYASYGIGQGTHVAMVRLLNATGVRLSHIPYKDGGINDVISGTVNVSFEASTTAIPQSKAGKVRALAISSAKRLETLPDVPTVGESVPGFMADSWTGVFGLKGTPPEVIAKLAAESQKIVEADDFRAKLRELGLTPGGGTPAEFARLIADDSRAWAKVVRENDIKVE
jgi:tripartite-type tricarboxylate transporter receptor subunit TctC